MKTGDKISLEKLLSIYSDPNHLRLYKDQPQLLKAELIDVTTIINLSSLQFTQKAKLLKKKSDQYLSNVKYCINQTRELLVNLPRSMASQRLAYSILAKTTLAERNAQIGIDYTSIIKETKDNIIKQMKIKFMQSKNIDIVWNNVYNPGESVLIFQQHPIMLKIGLTMRQSQVVWFVKEVSYLNEINFLLMQYYCFNLLPTIQMLYSKQQAEKHILQYICKSFKYIKLILVHQKIISQLQLKTDQYQVIIDELTFNFSSVIQSNNPNVTISRDQVLMIQLEINNFQVKSAIKIMNQDNLHEKFELKGQYPMQWLDYNHMNDFAKFVEKMINLIKQVIINYTWIDLQIHIFIIKWYNFYWKSTILTPDQQYAYNSQNYNNGLSIMVPMQISNIILGVNNDASLYNKFMELGMISWLSNNSSYYEAILHLQLRRHLYECNLQFDFKVYRIQISDKYIQYEFREHLGNQHIKYHRIQQDHSDKKRQDIFVIRMIISNNFKLLKLIAHRPQLPQQEIPDHFLSSKWRQYKNNKNLDQYLLIQNILSCLKYICHHYIFQRFYHHRIKDKSTIKFSFL